MGWLRHFGAATVLMLVSAAPAFAQDCGVRINGNDFVVDAEQFADGTATRRERILNWPQRGLSRLRGNLPTCPSDVTLNFLAVLEGLPDTEGYCLTDSDTDAGLLLVPGERNFRGRCTVSTCERVTGTAAEVQALASQVTDFAYGTAPEDSDAVAHSSGSVLLSASKFTLQRSLEGGATSALGTLLASPAIAGGTALTVVAVGGGVWLCSE
ncbi:MAG: hypothetical protein AAF801_08290 [Pseudomonadota bacterium]